MSKQNLPTVKDESLFSLVQLSHKIQEGLIESMGELTPEIEQAIAKLHQKLPDKASGYKFFIDDLESQAEVFKERAAIFTRIAKVFMNYTDRLKYSLKMACIELGTEEIEGKDFRWKLINNAPALVVDDDGLIPAKFKEIVQTTKIRSDLIKEALKRGEIVPGARLEAGSRVQAFPNTKAK